MENKRNLLLLILAFISLNVYLFATAPAPLPDGEQKSGAKLIPVEEAFSILARENDAARMLYTNLIVGEGEKVNLWFREDWKEKEVDAGPLPSLFLRGTATYMEKHPLPLSLFLGSDFPISTANKFSGIQEAYFNQMKKDKLPKYFFDEGTRMYTAMFPDMASVNTCVSCHNEHPDSPKTDWKLGDMMGATTWTFPDDSVSVEKITEMIAVYRTGTRQTYDSYINKINSFHTVKKPQIGTKWPSNGYFIPSTEVFLDSVNVSVASKTLNHLLRYSE